MAKFWKHSDKLILITGLRKQTIASVSLYKSQNVSQYSNTIVMCTFFNFSVILKRGQKSEKQTGDCRTCVCVDCKMLGLQDSLGRYLHKEDSKDLGLKVLHYFSFEVGEIRTSLSPLYRGN